MAAVAFEIRENTIAGIKKIKQKLPILLEKFTREVADYVYDETKRIAKQNVLPGAGVGDIHYHDKFVQVARGDEWLITNEAFNPLHDNYEYAGVVEFGHGQHITVPLVRSAGQLTALGHWLLGSPQGNMAMTKRGLTWDGKHFYKVTPEGKRRKNDFMMVRAPGRYPMTEGFEAGKRKAEEWFTAFARRLAE